MGQDYSNLNPRSMLGGSQVTASVAPVWSSAEIDSISNVFDHLRSGQQLTPPQIDSATEQLARGIGHPSHQSQVGTLISALYESSPSPQSQARIIGILLSPGNESLLAQLVNTPGAENLLAKALTPQQCERLLKIAREPNSATRVQSLAHFIREQINPAPHGNGTTGFPMLPREHPGADTPGSSPNPKDLALKSKEHLVSKIAMGGDVPDVLLNAIEAGDVAQVKILIDQASYTVEITHQLASMGDKATHVLNQLLQDEKYRNVAFQAIQISNNASQIEQQVEHRSFGPAPSTQTSSVINTANLERLLINPETLPATLGKLIDMEPRGQASLCELLVSL